MNINFPKYPKFHVNTIKSITLTILLSLGTTCMAQDLIANQAPSDKKMHDISAVKLNRTIKADLNDPASDIYTNWTRSIRTEEGHVPANYKIDLRGFAMPTTSRQINSQFGRRWGKQHEGLDIKVYTGDTIRSAFDGKVRIVGWNGRGYGYYIVIRHPNGLETLYGHLSRQLVREDQIVRAGEVIGLGGNTGRSSGSHLHFETRLLGQPINPALLFDFPNQDVTGDFYTLQNRTITKGDLALTTTRQMEEQQKMRDGAQLVSANIPERTVENAATEEATQDMATVQPSKSKKSSRRGQRTSSTYRVKSGDTLSKIAQRHGTTVSKLCKLNGIKQNAVLRKGQVLRCS